MNLNETFLDLADRAEVNVKSLPELSAAELNAHPGDHANSIAWLLWHAGRVLDSMIAPLSGKDQVWESEGFRSRFDLGEIGDGVGVGHTAEEARQIVVNDTSLLVDYVAAGLEAYRGYIASVEKPEDFDEIIGEFMGAPETRQARVTLVIVDALRHIDQALYVAGMPELLR